MLTLDPYDKKFFENPKALGSFFFPSIRKLVWAGAWQVLSLMPNKEFSNFNSNDVSRFPIVSIQVKFHSCPVWSSVIWLYAWMDSSLMKCGTELAKVFTIFNKGRISRCAQIFFYGWNSNRVLFEVFSTAKSNSVLFWTTSNSLTTCAHTQNKLSIFCGIFQAILFIKAYYHGTRFD